MSKLLKVWKKSDSWGITQNIARKSRELTILIEPRKAYLNLSSSKEQSIAQK